MPARDVNAGLCVDYGQPRDGNALCLAQMQGVCLGVQALCLVSECEEQRHVLNHYGCGVHSLCQKFG